MPSHSCTDEPLQSLPIPFPFTLEASFCPALLPQQKLLLDMHSSCFPTGDIPSLTDISFEIRETQQALDSQCVNTHSSAPPGVLGVLPRPAGLLWLTNVQSLSNRTLLLSRGETPNAVSPAWLLSGGSTCTANQNKAVT